MPATQFAPAPEITDIDNSMKTSGHVDRVGVQDDNFQVDFLYRLRSFLLDPRTRSRRAIERLRPREFDQPIEDLERELFARVGGIAYFIVNTDKNEYLGPLRTREEVVRACRIHFRNAHSLHILENEPEHGPALIG